MFNTVKTIKSDPDDKLKTLDGPDGQKKPTDIGDTDFVHFRNENVFATDGKNSKDDRKEGEKMKINIEQGACLLSRPTMVFILEQHNLEKLRHSLKRSLRIATCRIYSLQALNWLMRSVTQTSCLHDLMWWFVSSLKPPIDESISKIDDSVRAIIAFL